MSVLFTKDKNKVYSYDKNLDKIADKYDHEVKGKFICVDNGVLFTKDKNKVYSYDKNLDKIADKYDHEVKGDCLG